MKTVPFSDILAGVCQLVGLDRNTLNDKAFAAVRDLTSRRMNIIWDREEWPDMDRTLTTFPGTPVKSVVFTGTAMLAQDSDEILMENDSEILLEAPSTSTSLIRLNLETESFPRVYLAKFANDAYKKGTIESTSISISNPFYLTVDGDKKSISDVIVKRNNEAGDPINFQYTFETSGYDGRDEYITSVIFEVPNSTIDYGAYMGPNHPLTSKIVFGANQNLLVVLEDESAQALGAWNVDPRSSTRTTEQTFTVEDINDTDDIISGGVAVTQEYSYLRFLTSGQKVISYRKACPRLFGLPYSNGNTYQFASQVYYDPYQGNGDYTTFSKTQKEAGNFWKSEDTDGVQIPPALTSPSWTLVEIPFRFRDYLINGAAADFLRSEGRPEEANIFDQLAETAVQQQIDVLLRQQGQVQRMSMVYTY